MLYCSFLTLSARGRLPWVGRVTNSTLDMPWDVVRSEEPTALQLIEPPSRNIDQKIAYVAAFRINVLSIHLFQRPAVTQKKTFLSLKFSIYILFCGNRKKEQFIGAGGIQAAASGGGIAAQRGAPTAATAAGQKLY